MSQDQRLLISHWLKMKQEWTNTNTNMTWPNCDESWWVPANTTSSSSSAILPLLPQTQPPLKIDFLIAVPLRREGQLYRWPRHSLNHSPTIDIAEKHLPYNTPRNLWPFRHVIKVTRIHDMTWRKIFHSCDVFFLNLNGRIAELWNRFEPWISCTLQSNFCKDDCMETWMQCCSFYQVHFTWGQLHLNFRWLQANFYWFSWVYLQQFPKSLKRSFQHFDDAGMDLIRYL